MTLLEYRIFHTVTQQGSFARAAQILHLNAQRHQPRRQLDGRVLQAFRSSFAARAACR